MQKTYPTLITQESIVVLKGSKQLIARSSHPAYARILERVRKGSYTNIEALFDTKKIVEKSYGIEIRNNNTVFFRGKQVNNGVTNKILEYIRGGYNHKPLTRFLYRLLTRNPSSFSIDQLWAHISRYNFPIDSDGCFYSTKCIQNDWLDKYSKTISNRIGKEPKMDRNLISDQNTGNFCSSPGLYCGDLNLYVLGYYGDDNDRVVVVKIKPEDVCAVATDHEYAKIRVCRYLVTNYLGTVKELKGKDLVKYSDRAISGPKRDKSGQFC